MSIANGAQHSIHYVPEATYGTTPANPAFKPFPHTGTTLGMTKDGLESEKLRGDRQVVDFRHGNQSITGDVSAELEYGSFDDILQAVMCGTWTSDTLRSGVTRRSFTIERKFADLAVPEWHRHTGCEFNSFALSVSPNAIVSATFGVVGKGLTPATTAIAGSTYAAASSVQPFDSFTGGIEEGGLTIGIITRIECLLENGLEPLFAVGSKTTIRPSIGKSRATGNLTAYFESKALYEKFINETSSSIMLVLVDLAGNSYEFNLPNVKYNSGQPDVSGEGAVTISMDFIALYESVNASQILITRTPA
jgi:hypothetical protein